MTLYPSLLRKLLFQIEAELQAEALWQQTAPSAEALASQQPFAVDTLSFEQWLQFIFIPRFHALLDAQASLPAQCGILGMAEECWKQREPYPRHLLQLLAEFDAQFGQAQTGSAKS